MAAIVPASDRALLVRFSDRIDVAAAMAVRGLVATLSARPVAGVVDLHPAYASLLVAFDPLRVDAGALAAELASRVDAAAPPEIAPRRTLVVPVRYGGEDGPDLGEVARTTSLAPDEVVRRHADAAYEVAFVGFTPGFPYLVGLPAALATARRASPRVRVPAGSVAIAGLQAGVYGVASPGGWNVIGRTDLVVFDAARDPAALFAAGDLVRFVPVSA